MTGLRKIFAMQKLEELLLHGWTFKKNIFLQQFANNPKEKK